MYRGNLCSLDSYRHIPYKLVEIIQLVKRRIQTNDEEGTYPVIDDKVFFFVVEDETKCFAETRSEIHDKYIDIQIILKGIECFGYSEQPFYSIEKDFLEDRDVAFSQEVIDEKFVTLSQGDFIIFNTRQPHRPLIAKEKPERVKKVVIKVNKEYLNKFIEV
ncbi:YhcH/YjgK/YiaL family protein [Photobacterium lutimaris]|uniref:YhcH/YjgK/YiaL family protein n=1 Tax=Photobacterium lutimaris TaxID=388278 RepID=A0A2T3J3L0_9GAMM|nr:YhcH/YjgK/YiaL family protein [Photobacterium lutimaris]PSU35833.1 YhcH/YjgK/YiaL family protein [Photobacterium lutimaris]TDR78905.1 biofilm protein TabA [Photobacterium lutimaris]